MKKAQVSKKWKYECLRCSTQTKSIFTNGRKLKDGQIVCGRCGSNELEKVK